MRSLKVNFLNMEGVFHKCLPIHYFHYLQSIFANFLVKNLVQESIISCVSSEWVTMDDMAMEKVQICWFLLWSLWVFRILAYIQIMCKSIEKMWSYGKKS